MNPQAFIFYGASGSGKGTQAKFLIEYLEKTKDKSVLYVETGQRFRDFLSSGTYTSKLTSEVLNKGGLLPAFLPIWTWTDFLNKNFNGTENLVLDGLCRRPNEAPVLDTALDFYGIDNPNVIVLNVSREILTERLKSRGRKDDSSDYISRRLDWYENEAIPTIEFFRNKSKYKVIDVDGEKPVDKVFNEIITKLGV